MWIRRIKHFVLATSYFRPIGLSSPQLRFTSVFGMGTGVAIAPNHQNKGFNFHKGCYSQIIVAFKFPNRNRRISTSRLNTLLCVHLKPINVVISHGSQTILNLGAGFILRCFQNLSIPDIATLRCPWQDSSQTRGQFNSVLSY